MLGKMTKWKDWILFDRGLGELARIESSEIKLSNPFISQSITPQVFPRGSFLDPNFPLQSFEGEKD